MLINRNDALAILTMLASVGAFASAIATTPLHNSTLTNVLVIAGALGQVANQLLRVYGAPSGGSVALTKGPFAATVAPIASPTLVAATVAPIANPTLVATVVDPTTLEPVSRDAQSRFRAQALLASTQSAQPLASTSEGVLTVSFDIKALITDAQIAEAILGDVVAFAGGQPVTQNFSVAGKPYYAEIIVLPQGPTPQFQPVEGNVFTLLGIVLNDAALFQAGQAVSLAIKFGNTWYGVAFGLVQRTPAAGATS